jgi:hypothetical protein
VFENKKDWGIDGVMVREEVILLSGIQIFLRGVMFYGI